jgi:hypothetical protein
MKRKTLNLCCKCNIKHGDIEIPPGPSRTACLPVGSNG